MKVLRFAGGQMWMWVAAVVLRVGLPHHGTRLKSWVVRRYIDDVGPRAVLSPNLRVFRGTNTKIGADCSLGYNFQIFDFEAVEIGDGLLASHNVTLIAGTHLQDAKRTYVPGPITIGKNVWIGANVLIVGPAAIGDDVVIGANSYVTGTVAANSVIGGSPARDLRPRAGRGSV